MLKTACSFTEVNNILCKPMYCQGNLKTLTKREGRGSWLGLQISRMHMSLGGSREEEITESYLKAVGSGAMCMLLS